MTAKESQESRLPVDPLWQPIDKGQEESSRHDEDRFGEKRAHGYGQRAKAHYLRWEAEACLGAYEKAIELAPENPDYHLGLAAALVRFGKIEAALAKLRHYLTLESATPTAQRMRILLVEQEAQRQICAIRDRLAAERANLRERKRLAEQQIAQKLVAQIEETRTKAHQLRHWIRRHLVAVLDRPLHFPPSGAVVIEAGEPVSEDHLLVLERVVQKHAQGLEKEAEQRRAKESRVLARAEAQAVKAAEEAIVRVQESSESVADPVELLLRRRMHADGLSGPEIAAAQAMWLEYRICMGRSPVAMRKPASWAAGIDYTLRRVCFRKARLEHMADLYHVSKLALRARHKALVEDLDIMPCDYRYFVGDENPLDRLVEAATMLEALERRFREPPED